MLQERKDNDSKANELGVTIANAPSLSQIITSLGGTAPPDEQPAGIPPVPTFPPGLVAPPSPEVEEEIEKDSRFEVISQFYQKYLGRGPDVEGAAYWLKEHPDIQTPEGFEALNHNTPALAGRRACIEKMNLQLPQDNTRLVYYEMCIHQHWGKYPALPAPTTDEFADLAVAYARQLPPMPADFVVKDLYFIDEWDEILGHID